MRSVTVISVLVLCASACSTSRGTGSGEAKPSIIGISCPAKNAITITGSLTADTTPLTLSTAALKATHKLDIDPEEDGCLAALELTLSSQPGMDTGCTLNLQTGPYHAGQGGFPIHWVQLSADSLCPGFLDDDEGEYTSLVGQYVGIIVLGGSALQGAPNESDRCWTGIVALTLSAELKRADGQALKVVSSKLSLNGDFTSQGSTDVSCVPVGGPGPGTGEGTTSGPGTTTGEPDAEDSVAACQDGVDNDQNGYTDCKDFSCSKSSDPEVAALCGCAPDCAGKDCGSDGCGGECGVCNDTAEPCVKVVCGSNSQCESIPLNGQCDDGDPCTSSDICKGGSCVGDPVVCVDDGNPCTVVSCDSQEGCVSARWSDDLFTCTKSNEFGTCNGICSELTCDAATPAPEECNGKDDDCNGLADDGFKDWKECETQNEFGTCSGVLLCMGANGFVCNAGQAAQEICGDSVDNDCDGKIDEDCGSSDG